MQVIHLNLKPVPFKINLAISEALINWKVPKKVVLTIISYYEVVSLNTNRVYYFRF